MNILPRALALAAFFTLHLASILPAQDAPPSPAPAAAPTPHAGHVVIMVWDGLRPDSITEQATPTLFKLANDGVFFARHHSVYPSSTEVNGTAMATGDYPAHSGLIGNREYRPLIDPLHSVATEDLHTIRRGDAITGNHYLRVPTLAEIAHAAGWRTAIAGTKQVVVLQDRANRPDADKLADESVDLFAGQTLPEHAAQLLAAQLGSPFPPDIRLPNVDEDAWTTRALTQALWKDDLPKISVLWMSDPDFTQHRFGPDSPQALKALASDDANLATVLSVLDQRGWRDTTDVFVVSDHGFSTIERQIDVARDLVAAGFDAVREFHATPTPGQVLVVGLGGTVYLYVADHDAATIRKLAAHLQRTTYAGVILTRGDALPGTFPLRVVHVDSPDAPDLAVALRWDDGPNAQGFPGRMNSDGERKAGQGSHASLSRYELHNTLVANGPSFRRGFRDELPTGNVDLAPTIARILHLPNPAAPGKSAADQPLTMAHVIDPPDVPHMDGRVLGEAFSGAQTQTATLAAPRTERLEAARDADGTPWKQYLQITHYSGVDYLDEGNTGTPLPAPEPIVAPAPTPTPQ